MFSLFALFNDEPEVFLPKYSQTSLLHATHFRRVVNLYIYVLSTGVKVVLVVGLREGGVREGVWEVTGSSRPRMELVPGETQVRQASTTWWTEE